MKILHKILLPIMILALFACGGPESAPTEVPAEPTEVLRQEYVIGMMTIVSHPSLDAIQQGVKDQLKEAGFVEGENLVIIEGNAEGDFATLSTIAQLFLDEGVDLIVATTTPAAQVAYSATMDAEGPPIFFNGVSNPFVAEIATAPDDHPSWVIGSQLLDPVEDTMKLINELLPDVGTIGIIYNPAEANAVYLVEVAEEVAEDLGITLELTAVSNSNEIQTAADALVARDIDAFLAINDNTVTSGFEALVQVANDNDVPLFGTSASMPPKGAVASYGIDPYQEGLDSGEMVVKFLMGELDIATTDIPVQTAVLLTVNPAAAEMQGIVLPDALIARADSVIE